MDLKQPPISLSGATDRRSSGRSLCFHCAQSEDDDGYNHTDDDDYNDGDDDDGDAEGDYIDIDDDCNHDEDDEDQRFT